MTVPATGVAPGPVKVNVAVLIVAGRGVPSGVHVWLAFVGGRNAASRITGPVFQLCRYALGCEGPFEESAVKGSNNINLEQGLSCVNAIRKRCLFD